MGLVKTRRLARHSLRSAFSLPHGSRTPARGGYAMQKQQRAKRGMKPPMNGGAGKGNVSSLMHAHLKSKMQNRWAIVIDIRDVGLV